jgi:ribosomal protein S27E
MGRPSDWLREERRRTLGDWVAFCPDCGHAQRYFVEAEELGTACPPCGGTMLSRCPACSARIASMFAVDCDECGAPLRDSTAFGGPIQRERNRGGSGSS